MKNIKSKRDSRPDLNDVTSDLGIPQAGKET